MNRDAWEAMVGLIPSGRRRLAVVAALSAAGTVLEATVLIVVARVGVGLAEGGDRIGIGPVEASPSAWVAIACVALGVLMLVHWVFSRAAARLSADVLTAGRARLVRAFVGASYDRQSVAAEGSLQHAATTLAEQTSYLTLSTAIGLASLLNAVIMLLASGLVSPLATAGIVVMGVALFAVLKPVAGATRRASTRYVESNSRYGSMVAEQSQLALETRVFGVGPQREGALTDAGDRVGDDLAHARSVSLIGGFVFRDIALLVLLVGLGVLIGTDRVEIASIGPVLLLNVRAVSFAQGVQSARQVFNEHAPNLVALVSTIDEFERAAAPQGDVDIDSLGDVVLRDVSFAYPDAPSPTLRAVDLTIGRHDTVGLVGASGGGKTTLAQIVLGLLRPTQGHVLVGGHDLTTLSPRSWSRLVSAVPQEVRLVEGTIADNVRFSRPWIDDAAVERALDDAGVLSEVRRLPDGEHTRLGPRGSGLSGGQRQRIAIARALAGGAELLVLDEPTSALDPVSEQAIADTIVRLRGRVTLVVIAHRPATVDACERVIELRAGTVATLR